MALHKAFSVACVFLAVAIFTPTGVQAESLFDFLGGKLSLTGRAGSVEVSRDGQARRRYHQDDTNGVKLRFSAPFKSSGNQNLNALVASAAVRHGVPAALVHRIISVESHGRCNAENGIASGVMQVRPSTARSVGVHGNLHNCSTGVEAGVRYLKLALRAADGNWTHAATLYNRGIGAQPGRSRYSRMVMR